jgi:TolB-like protein/AraC-like DNA-binding protein/Tfp pilus assembly protein PilF
VSEPFTTDQIFIRKLTAIILANLGNENFGPKELAHDAGISLYRLNRRLHPINGKTSSQFIREVRLQKALELLQNEPYTVSEVAYRTGFSSPSYFISCFHEYFGYPPGKVNRSGTESREENIAIGATTITEQKRPARRIIVFTFSGVLILSVLVYLTYTLFSGNFSADKSTPAVNTRKSIAVLPFRNLSNNYADQYIYDGVMEEIFNSLTKIHELRVISQTSVEQYRNTTKTVSEIGKLLDVDYIIEGSGQKFGSTFRMRVQLIEVSTDMHIWTKSFQHSMKETKKLFRIQSRIARNIASELKATITLKEKTLIEKVPTANSTAYNLYLKANSYIKDYENTRNSGTYQAAVDLYNAALELDTAYAKAYTGLAFAYWDRYYYETYFKESFMDSCRIMADKALLYDSLLDEAYFIKGQYYRVIGQTEEALNNYDKALEINPNYYAAYERKGYLLTWILGDYVKGLGNCQKALSLVRGNDRPNLLKVLARAYLDVGFIDKAKYYYHEAFVLDSNKASWLGNIAFVEFCFENFEGALNLWKQLEEIDSTSTASENYYYVTPGHNEEAYHQAIKNIEKFKKSGTLNLVRSHRIGYAFWQVGKKKEAEYYFNQQIRYDEESIKLSRDIDQRKAAQYDLAGTYAFLGDKGKAYRYLEEYSKKNTIALPMVVYAKHDLLFESIRNEERFQKILKTIVSKYLAERERVRKWIKEQGML